MFFSFGKKRRSTRKSSKKGGKPPAKLLKICRKLKVKTTVKRGGSRVYKKKSVLKKLCLKKLKVMKKKKMMKKKALKRRVKRVSSRMGGSEFGARRTRFGSSCGSSYAPAPGAMMGFGRNITFGGQNFGGMEFGKRRRKSVKMSKAAAMKAFKAFYRRHCSVRRSRFGSGGNPPLSASMGYEFCPSGMGGVLGAMGTGLFASPCTPKNAAQAAAEANLTLPSYQTSAGTTAFGKRRRRRVSRKTAKVPKTKSGLKKALAKCRKMLKKRKVCRRKY